jgi:peroxiredoxin
MRPSVLAVVLASLLACACEPSALPAGKSAPDFGGTTIDGRTFRLSQTNAEGPVLLYFFTTASEGSLAELPSMVALHKARAKEGLRVIGVSMDGPLHMADVTAWAGRNGVTFPIVRDEDTRISNLYNPAKAPHLIVLIDRHGTIVRVREGWIAGDEAILAHEADHLIKGEPID